MRLQHASFQELIDELERRTARLESIPGGQPIARHMHAAIDELRIASAEWVAMVDKTTGGTS